MPSAPAVPQSCPRCRGRLFHARDRFGAYSSCLGCGFVHEWVRGPAVTLAQEPDSGRKRRREPTHGRRPL